MDLYYFRDLLWLLLAKCIPYRVCLVNHGEETLLSLKGEKIMFKRNVGILDRIVRIVLGAVLLPAGLFVLGGLQGSVLGLLIAGFGVLGLVTGSTGYCPLYVPFGISTLEKERELIAKCTSMMAAIRPCGDQSASQMCGCDPQSIRKTHNSQQ
jgi:hypothetical protein